MFACRLPFVHTAPKYSNLNHLRLQRPRCYSPATTHAQRAECPDMGTGLNPHPAPLGAILERRPRFSDHHCSLL